MTVRVNICLPVHPHHMSATPNVNFTTTELSTKFKKQFPRNLKTAASRTQETAPKPHVTQTQTHIWSCMSNDPQRTLEPSLTFNSLHADFF